MLVASAAMAHGHDHSNIPVLRCWNAATEVACASGWSAGVPMRNATLEVIGQDGKTLAMVKTDAKGQARFTRPPGNFTVLLHDRSNGQTVEVDQWDVDASKPIASDAWREDE